MRHICVMMSHRLSTCREKVNTSLRLERSCYLCVESLECAVLKKPLPGQVCVVPGSEDSSTCAGVEPVAEMISHCLHQTFSSSSSAQVTTSLHACSGFTAMLERTHCEGEGRSP